MDSQPVNGSGFLVGNTRENKHQTVNAIPPAFSINFCNTLFCGQSFAYSCLDSSRDKKRAHTKFTLVGALLEVYPLFNIIRLTPIFEHPVLIANVSYAGLVSIAYQYN